jgi:hypothetical protein
LPENTSPRIELAAQVTALATAFFVGRFVPLLPTHPKSVPSAPVPVGGRKPVAVEKAVAGVAAVRIGFHFGSRPLEMTLPI